MSPRVPLACALAVALGPAVAFADDDRPAGEDAQALVRRGVELRRQHRNQEALDAFRSAQAAAPSPRIRAQVALAEQALGEWLGAADDLDAVLADADDEWIARNRDALQEARATVEGHLAFLTVDVLAPRPAHVDLDGLVVKPGTETRVPAAPGTLVTRADEFAPDVQRITPAPGEHLRIVVSLIRFGVRGSPSPMPPEVLAVPTRLERPAARTRSIAGPVALASFGFVGLVTGSIFGLRTIHEKNERDAQCVEGCTADGMKFDSRARSAATVSDVAFGAGVTLLAGGGLWWFLSGRSGPKLGAIAAPGTFALTFRGSL